MKKVQIAIKALHAILVVVATASLILTVCVHGNDDTTIKLALMFLASSAICVVCALLENFIDSHIDRQIVELDRAQQEKRMFCNIKPCRDGWERKAM